MKVDYYGEEAPKSLLPLVGILVAVWVVIATVVIINCGSVLGAM